MGIWYFLVFKMFEDVKEYFNWYNNCKDIFENLKDFLVFCVGFVL